MDIHRRIIGILYLISGLIGIFVLVIASIVLSIGYITSVHEIEHFFALPEAFQLLIITTIVTVVLVISLPSIIIGLGLLYNKKWAENASLVLGCIYLFLPTLGTLLGIYTIIIAFVRSEEKKKKEKALVPSQI